VAPTAFALVLHTALFLCVPSYALWLTASSKQSSHELHED
jgi:hypothetical protein